MQVDERIAMDDDRPQGRRPVGAMFEDRTFLTNDFDFENFKTFLLRTLNFFSLTFSSFFGNHHSYGKRDSIDPIYPILCIYVCV